MAMNESSGRHKAMVSGLTMWENLAGHDRQAIVEIAEGGRLRTTEHGSIRDAVLRWTSVSDAVQSRSHLTLVPFIRGFLGHRDLSAPDSVCRGYWWAGKHVAKDWHSRK